MSENSIKGIISIKEVVIQMIVSITTAILLLFIHSLKSGLFFPN